MSSPELSAPGLLNPHGADRVNRRWIARVVRHLPNLDAIVEIGYSDDKAGERCRTRSAATTAAYTGQSDSDHEFMRNW